MRGQHGKPKIIEYRDRLVVATHNALTIANRSMEVVRNEGFLTFLHQISEKIARREFEISELMPGEREFARVHPTQVTGETEMLSPKFGVNLAGYFTGQFGIGTSSRAFAEALRQADVPHVLNKLVSGVHGDRLAFTSDFFSFANPYGINIAHVSPQDAKSFFARAGSGYVKDRFNVGVWYWEMAQFPLKWYDRFQYYDEIWVVSEFMAESVSRVSPVPIVKVRYPLLASINISPLTTRTQYGLNEDDFVFLYVFDFHSRIQRKNPQGLLDAFSDAFEGRDNAWLLLNGINGHVHPRDLQLIRTKTMGLKVKLLEEHLSQDEYYGLIGAADCYASLHRPEGFGVPMAEAMFLGKPVIATDYSGNMEYMNANNSLLVKSNLVELHKSYGQYEKGNVWAEPDLDQAAQLMRWAYENRNEIKRIGKVAQAEIRQQFNPALASREMKKRMERIFSNMNEATRGSNRSFKQAKRPLTYQR